MAVPVFFTAELVSMGDVRGGVVDEAIAALGAEIKSFFADKGDFVMGSGNDAVVGLTYDESAEDPNVVVAVATLVGGFRDPADGDAALALAKSFASEQFTRVTVSLDESSIVTHPQSGSDTAGAS